MPVVLHMPRRPKTTNAALVPNKGASVAEPSANLAKSEEAAFEKSGKQERLRW